LDNSVGIVDNIQYHTNEIVSSGGTAKTDLGAFLSRPTLIDTRTWTTATANGYLGSPLEVWYHYLNNTVITRKLRNFAFMRAKLCLKFVINATPFHYGLARVAYEPSVNSANTGYRKSKIRSNPTSTTQELIPLSQLPGTWLIPADNSAGEIHVPFFYHANWLNLKSAADAKSMGVLKYFVGFPLTLASASGSTSITINTYAWLEDVELSGTTAELTLQAADEYDGPVSSVASSVANIASKLDSVPVIGKFARATTIGASAIAKIASMFGFTNVPIIDAVHGFEPSAAPHLATTEISTMIQKLTVDPKQELSIDPTLHGIGPKDEMSISHLVSRPSILRIYNWNTSDAVGAVLFNSRVSPMMFDGQYILNGSSSQVATRVYHTPMSYIATMFAHWRGDIYFEFEVVCTKFHKGRLKISWDPTGSGGTADLPENTVYTAILDIGANNKATFRVPYHQAYSFLRMRGIGALNWSQNTSMPADPLLDNGLLIVTVLTPLVSPVSPQFVGIKATVWGADNLELANPVDSISDGTPPSFFDVQAKDEVDTESREVTFGDEGGKHPHRYEQNFGERIVSLRTLLHRRSLYDVSSMEPQSYTRAGLFVKSYTRFPPCFGYDPQGKFTANKVVAATGTANFNFAPTHPITYVGMMFGAYRGSVNYTINTCADNEVSDIRISRLNRDTKQDARAGLFANSINTGISKSAAVRYLNIVCNPGQAGALFTTTTTNGAVSWQAPHQQGTNFMYTDPTDSILGNTHDWSNRECTFLEIFLKQQTASTTTSNLTVTTYAGTGPDFTLLWFLCCPTLDYQLSVPVAP